MPSPRMPNFVRGLVAAGLDALRAVPSQLAPWQLQPGARIDTSLADPDALATALLDALKYPEHVFDRLPPDAQDRIAVALGLPRRDDWQAPPEDPSVPDHLQPSWESDVHAVLFLRERTPAPSLRNDPPRTSHARAWPELRSLDAWGRAREHAGALATELARALGSDWSPATPSRPGLPSVVSTKYDIALVAVPGGTFEMGLRPDERRELAQHARNAGPEAVAHARALAATAGPVRIVRVEPFLCARTPILGAHGQARDEAGDAGNAHDVARVTSEEAVVIARRIGLRLVAEAEWEWMARAGGRRSWLSGRRDPLDWAQHALATPLEEHAHPFDIAGLGWGEWVDDGWHPSYRGAPATAIAWDPKSRPEVVRGGALPLWPWQTGGEALLLHAAARDRAADGRHALRLAADLPERAHTAIDAPKARAATTPKARTTKTATTKESEATKRPAPKKPTERGARKRTSKRIIEEAKTRSSKKKSTSSAVRKRNDESPRSDKKSAPPRKAAKAPTRSGKKSASRRR